MGTSNQHKGSAGATPLVPSWLDDLDANPPANPPPAEPPPAPPPPGPPDQPRPDQQRPPLPPPAQEPRRFQSARTAYTRFARDGDQRSLRSALGNYVRHGTGGARGATARMGAARQTAGRLASFVAHAGQAGTEAALAHFGLSRCIGRPAAEVLPELIDTMCPPGGRIDENIAREALQAAIAELAQADLPPIEQLTAEQWREFLLDYLARSIELRVLTDIGQKLVTKTETVDDIIRAERVARQLIYHTVRNSLGDTLERAGAVAEGKMRAVTDQAYDRAWQAFAEFF